MFVKKLDHNLVLNIPKELSFFLNISSLSCAIIHGLLVYRLLYRPIDNYSYFIYIDVLLTIIFLISTFFVWQGFSKFIKKYNSRLIDARQNILIQEMFKKSSSKFSMIFLSLFFIGYLSSIYFFHEVKGYESISLLSVALVVVLLFLVVLFKSLKNKFTVD